MYNFNFFLLCSLLSYLLSSGGIGGKLLKVSFNTEVISTNVVFVWHTWPRKEVLYLQIYAYSPLSL